MLASGDHIVHLARDDFYVPILQDKESLNLDLIIESESGEKDVTIYNKIKGEFRIPFLRVSSSEISSSTLLTHSSQVNFTLTHIF